MRDTKPLLMVSDFPPLTRDKLEILQVNLGYTCNLSCTHCHVNAGPKRTEQMDKDNIDLVIDILKQHQVNTLDLTGGAPEMMPHFRYLVKAARALGVTVIFEGEMPYCFTKSSLLYCETVHICWAFSAYFGAKCCKKRHGKIGICSGKCSKARSCITKTVDTFVLKEE